MMIILIAHAIVHIEFKKTRYRPHFLLACCWGFLALFFLIRIAAYLLWIPVLMLFSAFTFIPLAISLFLLIDELEGGRRKQYRLAIYISISCFMISTAISKDAVVIIPIQNGYYGLYWGGCFHFFTLLLAAITGVSWLYYCIKIHKKSPDYLRFHSCILVIGSIFMGIIPFIVIALQLVQAHHGIEGFLMSVGAVFIAYAFVKQPKLIFVLPFNVQRLAVIETESGLPLFSHLWVKNSETLDEMLFSALIQGLSTILNEATHQGDVKEVIMSDGTLMIHDESDRKLAFVLVASNTSEILLNSLKKFAQEFISVYAKDLEYRVGVDTIKYEDAGNLVQKHFGYIP